MPGNGGRIGVPRAFTRGPRWKQLGDAGVRLLETLDDIARWRHFAFSRADLRDHRKIVVIDNRIAYCGSQNCADPEFAVKPEFAPWIDILLRCEGPIVRQQQTLFLSGWIAEKDRPEGMPAAEPLPARFPENAVVQAFETGPITRHNAMSDMFTACMYAARRGPLITTPYFMPDRAILRALCAAPRRGVKRRSSSRRATIRGWSAMPATAAPMPTCWRAASPCTNIHWACCTASR